MNDELLFYATETVKDYLAKAERFYGRSFLMPTIALDLRGHVAGYAQGKAILGKLIGGHIRLNAQLFRENTDEFISRTIPHELAHLISYQLFGTKEGRGHKAPWKSVMRALGIKDITRCHSYKTTPARIVKRKRFLYVCGCRNGAALVTHKVSTTVHNRIQKGRRYTCKKCKTAVRIFSFKPVVI